MNNQILITSIAVIGHAIDMKNISGNSSMSLYRNISPAILIPIMYKIINNAIIFI